jgi:hypothetical protein
MIGPDTPALGEVYGGDVATQAQVASTIARLLGLEGPYSASAPRAAQALRVMFGRSSLP